MKLLFENWREYLKEEREKTLPTKDQFIDWQIANWPKYGPAGSDPDAVTHLSLELYGMDFYDKDFNEEMQNHMIKLVRPLGDLLYSNELLPPTKEGDIRINHTTGLRGDYKDRYNTINSILQNGLQAQPEGSGKHSELPTGIFGLVDNPSAGRNNVYNKNFPWITFDLPKKEWNLEGYRPGSVAVLTGNIPKEYIVGVNGAPVDRYKQAMEQRTSETPI